MGGLAELDTVRAGHSFTENLLPHIWKEDM